MIEYGSIVNIKNNIVEIEIKPLESQIECIQCGKCYSQGSERQTIQAFNRVDARKGDFVKVYVQKTQAYFTFIFYLIPLLVFFLLYFFSGKYFHFSELSNALAGFTGFSLAIGFIALFTRNRVVKNYILSKEKLLVL